MWLLSSYDRLQSSSISVVLAKEGKKKAIAGRQSDKQEEKEVEREAAAAVKLS